jgi:hypothetical protein
MTEGKIPPLPTPDKNDIRLETSGIQHGLLAQSSFDPAHLRRYERFFTRLDRAIVLVFSDMEILDQSEVPLRVPTIFGTQEKIAYAIFGETTAQDPARYKRVRLPICAVQPTDDISIDLSRYVYHEAKWWRFGGSEKREDDVIFGEATGIPVDRGYQFTIHTRYVEDMNQLLEIALQRFSSTIEIRLGSSPLTTQVIFDGCTTNFSEDRDAEKVHLYRAVISMTAKSYIPQPVRRAKTVHKVVIDFGVGDPRRLGSFQSAGEITVKRPTG